jgi:hypothetical protein
VIVLAVPALADVPTIESVSPRFGPVGRIVTITGTDFRGPDLTTFSVQFGGVAAEFEVDSATGRPCR